MSLCIKDFYNYELVKECRVCKNILLKSNFYRHKTKRDDYISESISCCKEYYMNNSVKLIQKQKDYCLENQDRIINNQNCMINKIVIKLTLDRKSLLEKEETQI